MPYPPPSRRSGKSVEEENAVRTHLRAVRSMTAVVAAAGLVSGLTGMQTAAADVQMTATEAVNVRSGPSTSKGIVGGLYRGQTVTVVSNTGSWTKIKFSGGLAYIATQYLTSGRTLPAPAPAAAPTGAGRVTTTDLNLRKGPGLSYGVVRVVPDGARVTLTGKSSRGFAEVTYATSKGWVSTQYLASSASGLPAVTGTRYATANLSIRVTSANDTKIVGEIKKGTKLSVTGTTQNGRAQIVYANAVRWVTAKYLSNQAVTQPAVPSLPAVTGTRYATAGLLIRSTSGSTYTVITEVPTGTALEITGVVQNGRAQIVYLNTVRWVTAQYLSTKKPLTGGGSSGTPSYAVEKGLVPNSIKVHRASLAKFPQITTYYGVRPDAIPDHPSGRALDLMIPNYTTTSGKDLGALVAAWAQANQASLGIEYIIWNQRIWNVRRASEGWRYMADRGGDSANHKDHVHITVFK